MASVVARLSLPLVFAALACGSETPSNSTGGTGGAAGASTTGGSPTGGSSTAGSAMGGSTTGGAPQGGAGGASAGSAGQDVGGGSPGGADAGGTGGSGVVGGTAGSGTSGTGGAAGGVGGSAGSGLAGAPAGGAGSGDTYATGVTITVHPEIRTLLNVSWTQAVAAENVFLEFTFPQGDVMRSRPKPGTVGMKTDVVIGVPGSTNVTVRVVSRQGGVDYKTRDYMGMTGAIPAGMPVPQVTMYNAALASPEKWMLGAVENSDGGCNSQACYYNEIFWLYIIDRQGRIVWYYVDAASNATSSFQRAARDGGYLWIEKRPFSGGGTRTVLKRTLDGTYSESISVPISDNIDVTTDGSLLYDSQNILRERTRAGTTRDVFNCRTHFGTGFQCYTNTINWNERDDTVVMSYPDESTVIEVRRSNGQVVGQYGAETGSYTFAATPAPPGGGSWDFGYQHFANITKDGTLILSTHMPGHQGGTATRMPIAGEHAFEEYDIDRTNRRLTMRWFFQIPGQEWAMFKGMAMKLPNNNYIGNVGTGGVIREITPDKQTVFMVKFDAPPGANQNNDFFNKMVGHNFFVADLYSLNVGGPQ